MCRPRIRLPHGCWHLASRAISAPRTTASRLVRRSLRGGERLGVAVMMWNGGRLSFQRVAGLGAFLLILLCLTMAAVPITAHVVRKAIAPLGELAQFAEQTGEGHAPPPDRRAYGRRVRDARQRVQQDDFTARRLDAAHPGDRFRRPSHAVAEQGPVRRARSISSFCRARARPGRLRCSSCTRLPKLMHTLDPSAAREFLRVVAERFTTCGAHRRPRRALAWRRTSAAAVPARLGVVEFGVFAPDLASSVGRRAVRAASERRAESAVRMAWP